MPHDFFEEFEKKDNTFRCKQCNYQLNEEDANSHGAQVHYRDKHRAIYVKMNKEERAQKSPGYTKGSEDASQLNSDLIRLIRNNPCLYDKHHEHYKDVARKARVWEDLAKQLDMENGKAVMLKWKNLGDTYARNRKRQAANATITWPHYEDMKWLEIYRTGGAPLIMSAMAPPITSEAMTSDLQRSYDESLIQKLFVVMENNSVHAVNGMDELTAANNLSLSDISSICPYPDHEEEYVEEKYDKSGAFSDINFSIQSSSYSPSTIYTPATYTRPNVVDEPRLKRAREALDGIFYNRNKSNNEAAANNTLNGAASCASNGTANGTANVTSNGIISVKDAENSSGSVSANSTNNDNRFQVDSRFQGGSESQIFGSLIAHKLEDLDKSARLATQTEIIALINAKLLDSKHNNDANKSF